MEEASLGERGLGKVDIGNNLPVSKESENHKVGREGVLQEVFPEDNIKFVSLNFGIEGQHNCKEACLLLLCPCISRLPS